MLTVVETAAELVNKARTLAGLSTRALASRAGVPASTVSRIEASRVDPTIGMLRRLLDASGCDLRITSMSRRESTFPVLADMVSAWRTSSVGDRPEWTKLRSFLDHLYLHPEQIAAAILRRPAPSGSPMLDALLAGIAEKLADDFGLLRPRWATRNPGLDADWITPGTPQMHEAIRRNTPPQLSARRVFIDSGSLWRHVA